MIAYIGIGANLGDALAQVDDAIIRLGQLPATTLVAASPRYRSAPVDAGGDDYVNAVACIDTGLAAHSLLAALHGIEMAHGRQRPYRNAPRTLDLDILLYGDQRIEQPDLHVPHPRMGERAFVLLPLLDLAPQIVIPGRGPAQQLVAACAGQTITRI